MKNSMQVMCATLTSMEVAEMVEKTHDNLIKSIRRYSKYIDESNISLDAVKNDGISEKIDLGEFWTESTYVDELNRKKPCYNITKKRRKNK